MNRTGPVVNLPVVLDPSVPQFAELVELLRRHLGKVVSFASIALHLEHGGTTLTAGSGGTVLPASRTTIDIADTGVDSLRLVAAGSASASGMRLRLLDVTDSPVLLAELELPTSDTWVAGDWTRWAPTSRDRQLEVVVVGNGSATQTLTRVDVQLRTVHAT